MALIKPDVGSGVEDGNGGVVWDRGGPGGGKGREDGGAGGDVNFDKLNALGEGGLEGFGWR